jgi:hypothetical protein
MNGKMAVSVVSAMPTVPPAPLTSKAFQAQYQATEGRFRSAFLDQPI